MRALLVLSTLFLLFSCSGCNWLGLPDVTVLKNHYPVVHYRPVPERGHAGRVEGRVQASGHRSYRYRKGKRPKIRSEDELRDHYVTLEKHRPPYWVRLSDVSKDAVHAIIVSEDWAFYQHKGYDPNQLKEAIKTDVAEGKFARGGSTITQQLAKNVFLDSEKTLSRKLKEFFLAIELEKHFSKQKILENYLNVIEFGKGLYGIGPAARFYFHKSPKALTAKEGAFLAMLLPSPKRYSVSFRKRALTRYARRTVNSILGKMVQAHYISEEEKLAEESRPLSFEKSASESAPGFANGSTQGSTQRSRLTQGPVTQSTAPASAGSDKTESR